MSKIACPYCGQSMVQKKRPWPEHETLEAFEACIFLTERITGGARL